MNFTSSITLMFRDAFSSGFQRAQDSFAGMKAAMGEINQNSEMNRMAADISMMTAMTDPMRQALSGALNEPSQIAGELDSSLRNIQAVTGSTAEEMAGLRKELLAVGKNAVAGPEAVAGAYYDVASGVTDVSARMATLEASVALAEAGQANLGTATSGLIKVMNAYGYAADDANFAADVFTATVGKGVGSMDEFVDAMSPIAGLTASVGIGFDEVGASMAFITSKGQTATAASTQLRAAITSLLNPNDTLNGLLQSMGMASGSAMLQQHGLAGSLDMISNAVGGSQDAMARALGSTEALQGAIALTQDGFESFAASYAGGLDGITDQARGVQLESIEAKMARLEAASSSLQAQIGQDINGIKGFFIDMKTGFLNGVVSPIMNSPIGSVFSKITALTGMGAQSLLGMGSSALTAASQLAVLTASVQNAGGIAKLFTSSLGFMKSTVGAIFSPLKVMRQGIIKILPQMGVWIASTWSAAAAHIAMAWPIYAVIGAVVALAGGAILLVKHWDAVSGFFMRLWEGIKTAFAAAWDWIRSLFDRMPDWVLGLVAVFMPFISIPLLIVSNWDAISGFFSRLWDGVVGLFRAGIGLVKDLIFGTSDWIFGAVALFAPFIGIPALLMKHWETIRSFFAGLWDGLIQGFRSAWSSAKLTIMEFIDWITGVIDIFLAPFQAIFDGVSAIFEGIRDVAGGVFEKIGGFFGGIGGAFRNLIGGADESGGQMTTAFSQGIRANATAPAVAFGASLVGIDSQMPHSDAKEGPLSRLTASGRALTDTFAAGMDPSAITDRATTAFAGGLQPVNTSITFPHVDRVNTNSGPRTLHIENLYLQAEDCRTLFDFVRQIQHAAYRPQGAAV